MPASDQAIAWLDLPAGAPRAAGLAAGKAARTRLPRSAHGKWSPDPERPNRLDILRSGDAHRVPELLPIRYGRMLESPFAFFRGAAAIMAYDLSKIPVTGIRTQICGDCHLLNFGAFATPERNLVFDVNDFDETLPGAWEWDVKRLAASVVVAARHLNLRVKERRDAVLRCVGAYRNQISLYADSRVLDIWYARFDAQQLGALVRSAQARRQYTDPSAPRPATSGHAFPHFTQTVDGRRHIVDEPPLIFHPQDDAFGATVIDMVAQYRASMSDDRKALLDRFHLVDAAFHVVGVGSVGTRCLVALFVAEDDDPLVLQAKQALPSVFEPYAGASAYKCQGERVVVGQHLMQAASDLFLGWAEAEDGNDFYVRQLRDMKTSASVDRMTGEDLAQYAQFCGRTLARGHAKAGGVAGAISAYLGRGEAFDLALAAFATEYAEQNERDYACLVEAVKAGTIEAQTPSTPGRG